MQQTMIEAVVKSNTVRKDFVRKKVPCCLFVPLSFCGEKDYDS